MHDDPLIIDALDLAERILDELASADPNWAAVEHMAEALAKLAARGVSEARRHPP